MTSFNPDHTSLTAHTLTSTKPSGRATARMASSVTSVSSFEAFFGHDTHTNPVCFSPAPQIRQLLLERRALRDEDMNGLKLITAALRRDRNALRNRAQPDAVCARRVDDDPLHRRRHAQFSS